MRQVRMTAIIDAYATFTAMEDAHTTALKLKDGEGEEDDGNSFFAVYDGHGGA